MCAKLLALSITANAQARHTGNHLSGQVAYRPNHSQVVCESKHLLRLRRGLCTNNTAIIEPRKPRIYIHCVGDAQPAGGVRPLVGYNGRGRLIIYRI